MPTVKLTEALREEYQKLFDTCRIADDKMPTITAIIAKIAANQNHYESVGGSLNIPWWFISVIHSLESSLNFKTHLHNGDPLAHRTVHDPSGRPPKGDPPFTWEESAADALKLKKLDKWTDWSVPAALYKIEEYNGWGYRLYHPHVLSPYLWSFSQHYTSGKYISDGTWSDTAKSGQAGAAVLLRRMAETGAIAFPLPSAPKIGPEPQDEPIIRYATAEKSNTAEELQRFLNRLPGIYVREDGYPGEKTSDAFKKATGFFLYGDPRSKN